MLRRKLAVFTLLYIAGIAAGFFIIEKSRVPESVGFIISVAAVIRLSGCNAEDGAQVSADMGIRLVLLLFFSAGFVLFSLRAYTYDSSLRAIDDKNYVCGTVVSASVKKDKLQLIVRNTEKGPAKVLVILDEEAAFRAEGANANNDESGMRTAEAFYIGKIIEARGEYQEIYAADNPGCFDYRVYMRSKGVCVQFRAYIADILSERKPVSAAVKQYLYDERESFLQRFDTDTEGFIRGVIFGDKSEIDEDLLDEFNLNSTGHILAVSGLHIGFLYGLLKMLTGRRRTLPVSLLILAVIIIYGEMTMWSPATVRACIVMTVSLLSVHLRRHSDLLTSISFAAMIILTAEPYQLFNSGFQLSFLALCGIAFLAGPIATVTGEGLAVMLAVQIGTLPVIAYSFCRINPLSILINVPVILLASVLVPVCIFLLLLEAALGAVPAAGIRLAELISYAVIKLNHLLSFGGSFSIRTTGPGAAAIIALYAFAFGASSEWVRVMLLRKNRIAVLKQSVLILMPVIMISACLYDRIADDEIVFVAVGQGDCTHIRADGHDILIDGGGQTDYSDKSGDDSGYNVGKKNLMPYLLHSGAGKLDLALVTHLHADHFKGITELAEIYPVGAVGIPIDYRASPDSDDLLHSGSAPLKDDIKGPSGPAGTELFYIKPDTRVDITDAVSVEVIWPAEISDEPLAADDPNEHNTVYMVNYKGTKVMVTGDLLEEDERRMLDYYEGTDTLKCDILKVAHHGSKTSSCEEFLDAASPKIAVIECGRNNFYGHPHQQTLDRLEERGIKLFRTDISGAVGIDIRKGKLLVDLFK